MLDCKKALLIWSWFPIPQRYWTCNNGHDGKEEHFLRKTNKKYFAQKYFLHFYHQYFFRLLKIDSTNYKYAIVCD